MKLNKNPKWIHLKLSRKNDKNKGQDSCAEQNGLHATGHLCGSTMD